jgi:hypothetical protein
MKHKHTSGMILTDLMLNVTIIYTVLFLGYLVMTLFQGGTV